MRESGLLQFLAAALLLQNHLPAVTGEEKLLCIAGMIDRDTKYKEERISKLNTT